MLEPVRQNVLGRPGLTAALVLGALLPAMTGCGAIGKLLGIREPVHFPLRSLTAEAEAAKAAAAYDADHDGKADFFLYADANGRANKIAYDTTGDEKPDQVIALDAIPFARCRHLVLILDGFAYEIVKERHDQGGLRLFHPPSKLVAPYPSMTDLALVDALRCMPCPAIEALYYDRKANKLVGGVGAYLGGKNQPYNARVHYQIGTFWHAFGYLWPRQLFGKDLNDAKRHFDRARTAEVIVYFVSTAGVSTKSGAEGQKICLDRVEQLVNQVVYETRGLTKVTLLSDHGHSYTPAARIGLESHLKSRDWRLTDRLRRPRDVVFIRFGLVTFAAFMTGEPSALADDLVACEGVELASYAEQDRVVVLARDGGRAVIHRKGDAYKYETMAGDPLRLQKVLAEIEPDGDGFVSGDAELAATIDHAYPAPLQRLWHAHFAQVQNPPDVLASLADNFYSGAKSFGASVKVASTHGSLNRRNSVAFIMSTAAPLPAYLRPADVPNCMAEIAGEPWPLNR